MRLPRRTFQGAFHHAMNRGYEGRALLRDDADRIFFLELLRKIQGLTRLRILAYCLMNTHYHMVLQDNNGKMSVFFKQLNGQYAGYFRQRYGGRGYVFQDRFKSMLIQDDAYLMVAIGYVLNNPVRAGIIKDVAEYKWSSGKEYFREKKPGIVDVGFVEELFGNAEEFNGFVKRLPIDALPTVRTELGTIIGGED
ncbi:MAG: transposase, partial [Candidatus Aminicenantes bacterium]|nr:transposase [Candidatus Aminicenantes bacterium]